MTRATCHPARPHCARGMCRSCAVAWYRRRAKAKKWEALRRPCNLCSRPFIPNREEGLYCSKTCLIVSTELSRWRKRNPNSAEDRFVTRDPDEVRSIIHTALERGCRMLSRYVREEATLGSYVCAWRRGGLYLVRVRWAEGEEVAA